MITRNSQEFRYNILRPGVPDMICAPVAQLDRVPGYELGGRTFESCRVRHLVFTLKKPLNALKVSLVSGVGKPSLRKFANLSEKVNLNTA